MTWEEALYSLQLMGEERIGAAMRESQRAEAADEDARVARLSRAVRGR